MRCYNSREKERYWIKVLFGIIFLPLILIGLVVGGLMTIALPILVIAGIGMLVYRLVAA